MRRMVRRVLLAVAVIASIVTAAPAQADAMGFLSEIDGMGLPDPTGTSMVQLGAAICHDVRGGASVLELLWAMSGSPFTGYQQGQIVFAATDQLCFDQQARVLAEARQFLNGGRVI